MNIKTVRFVTFIFNFMKCDLRAFELCHFLSRFIKNSFNLNSSLRILSASSLESFDAEFSEN